MINYNLNQQLCLETQKNRNLESFVEQLKSYIQSISGHQTQNNNFMRELGQVLTRSTEKLTLQDEAAKNLDQQLLSEIEKNRNLENTVLQLKSQIEDIQTNKSYLMLELEKVGTENIQKQTKMHNETLKLNQQLSAKYQEIWGLETNIDQLEKKLKNLNLIQTENIQLRIDRKSTRLNSSHVSQSRMPSSA